MQPSLGVGFSGYREDQFLHILGHFKRGGFCPGRKADQFHCCFTRELHLLCKHNLNLRRITLGRFSQCHRGSHKLILDLQRGQLGAYIAIPPFDTRRSNQCNLVGSYLRSATSAEIISRFIFVGCNRD